MKKPTRSFFLFFILFFVSLNGLCLATFYGTPKTGLQNFGRDPYAYSVFVPQNYTPEHNWPLVIALQAAGKAGNETVQSWAREAGERGYILLCPAAPALISRSQTGDDTRILKLKAEVQSQYEIDPERVLLTGAGDAGHYALYLGLQHSREFSAIACVGNAAAGPLAKLFKFSLTTARRMPLLFLIGPQKGADDPALTADVEVFKKEGYAVQVIGSDALQSASDTAAHPFIMNWFEEELSKK